MREHPINDRLDGDVSPDTFFGLAELERIELVRLMRLPPPDQQKQLDAMERGKRRRFERAMEQMREERDKHGKTTLTKAHLAWVLGRYTETKLVPLAAKLDGIEAALSVLAEQVSYLSLPFYRRWWVDLQRFRRFAIPRLRAWLERRGVRFVDDVDADAAARAEAQKLLEEQSPPAGETPP